MKIKFCIKVFAEYSENSMASLVWRSLGFAIQIKHVQVNRIKYSAKTTKTLPNVIDRAHIFTFLPIDGGEKEPAGRAEKLPANMQSFQE